MAPKHSKFDIRTEWWENAYKNQGHILVTYEIMLGKDVVRPGTIIRIKNTRGTFRFRCIARNMQSDKEWLDCINVATGEWKSFPVEMAKCVVKPKKSRRKKANA